MIFHRRHFLFLGLLLPVLFVTVTETHAQRRITDRVDPIEELDPKRGAAFLREFRQLGMRGGYGFEFELRTMPFRGEERFLDGRMWGDRDATGPVTLLEIRDRRDPDKHIRLLVHSGESAAVWMAEKDEAGTFEARRLDVEDWFLPIMGTDYTPFDLQMPFVYWEEFEYEGIFRVRGRPCHIFAMTPPEDFREQRPGLAAVRMYLDAEFQALFRAESVGRDGKVKRVFSVIDFKKVQDEWIVKTIDLRDEATRDKTRFRVNRAAMNVTLPEGAFNPRNLGEDPPALRRDRYSPLN